MCPLNNRPRGLARPSDAANRLIVALSEDNLEQSRHYADLLGENARTYSLGLPTLMSPGTRQLVEFLRDQGKTVIADHKLFGDTREVAAAVRRLENQGFDAVTVHCDTPSMRGAAEARDSIALLAVTVLTSVGDDAQAADPVESANVAARVQRRANTAVEYGFDGVICSGHEARRIREAHPDTIIVVAGIREPGEDPNDHRRVVPLSVAFEAGADYVVIGRRIRNAIEPRIEASNIVARIQALTSTPP